MENWNVRMIQFYSSGRTGFEDDSWNSYGNDGGSWNRGHQSSAPLQLGPKRGNSAMKGGQGISRSAHCVLMRGLPFKASEDNIRTFFQPLIPTDIHIIYESSGRPSGTAKVEFASNDDVTRAMAKVCNNFNLIAIHLKFGIIIVLVTSLNIAQRADGTSVH